MRFTNILALLAFPTTFKYGECGLEPGGSWVKRGRTIDLGPYTEVRGMVGISEDGSRVAVGFKAIRETPAIGFAMVYEWDGSDWSQMGSTISGDTVAGNSLGQYIALSKSGSILAVANPSKEVNGSSAGAVTLYGWSGTSWVQWGSSIEADGSGDFLGDVSLSHDGLTVAIGSNRNDNAYSNAGQVRIYTWDGSTWTQKGAQILGKAVNEGVGYRVSLSDDATVVAISSIYFPNYDYKGLARVYYWTGSSWSPKGSDIYGEYDNDYFGLQISISGDGNYLAISGPLHAGSTGSNSGHIKVYYYNGSSWIRRGNDIEGDSSNQRIGYGGLTISDDGEVVIAGSTAGHGYAEVFEWSASSWGQPGTRVYGDDSNYDTTRDASYDFTESMMANPTGTAFVGLAETCYLEVYRYATPTETPSNAPSFEPSRHPSHEPSLNPSDGPSRYPSSIPTNEPSNYPSLKPSLKPTLIPSDQPSLKPSLTPSLSPSDKPSILPSVLPSSSPSDQPSILPSSLPSSSPSYQPSFLPSSLPSLLPSYQPSVLPSSLPSDQPSVFPSLSPSSSPSDQPSVLPSLSPSSQPSFLPSSPPSLLPSSSPSDQPSIFTSLSPSSLPSDQPSVLPSLSPSSQPSISPSSPPSLLPSYQPYVLPSDQSILPSPSAQLSVLPSSLLSSIPSLFTPFLPSTFPSPPKLSTDPSSTFSPEPSTTPSNGTISHKPSKSPTSDPSLLPSNFLSHIPTYTQSNLPSRIHSHNPAFFSTSYPSIFSVQPTTKVSLNPTLFLSAYPSNKSNKPAINKSASPSLPVSELSDEYLSFTPNLVSSHLPSSSPTNEASTSSLYLLSALPSEVPSIRPSAYVSAVVTNSEAWVDLIITGLSITDDNMNRSITDDNMNRFHMFIESFEAILKSYMSTSIPSATLRHVELESYSSNDSSTTITLRCLGDTSSTTDFKAIILDSVRTTLYQIKEIFIEHDSSIINVSLYDTVPFTYEPSFSSGKDSAYPSAEETVIVGPMLAAAIGAAAASASSASASAAAAASASDERIDVRDFNRASKLAQVPKLPSKRQAQVDFANKPSTEIHNNFEQVSKSMSDKESLDKLTGFTGSNNSLPNENRTELLLSSDMENPKIAPLEARSDKVNVEKQDTSLFSDNLRKSNNIVGVSSSTQVVTISRKSKISAVSDVDPLAPENFENHNTVTNEECLPNTNALTLKTDVVSSRGEKHSMLSSVSDTGAYQNDISTDSFINNREYNSSQKLGVRSDQESNERSDLRMGKRIVEDEGGDCFLDKLMIAEGALEDGWEDTFVWDKKEGNDKSLAIRKYFIYIIAILKIQSKTKN